MPDYRWGIFLAPPEPERAIAFGDPLGRPAWQQVPGELRATLRRLIVTQGDTEPASVEQQRRLGARAPSLYDLRNLLQVNVEEARHLWAMVYLLFSHFGRDGREEAEALLARESGEPDHPRILGAFNRPIATWLDFFCFATFTDRDGKYQLASLAESGFDPLSRTCRFMLTEEAHHLSVGEGGIRRIVARTAELMKRDPNEDARAQGGIDLPLLQRFINHWYSESLDLFGSPDSSNAATLLRDGPEGPLPGVEERRLRRPHAGRGRVRDREARRAAASSTQEVAAAPRDQRDAPGRLRARVREVARPLEPGARARPDSRSASRCRARASTARSARSPSRTGCRAARPPPTARRWPRIFRNEADAAWLEALQDGAGAGARSVRELDRGADAQDQRAAARLRVPEVRLS